jgi:thioredoxin 1
MIERLTLLLILALLAVLIYAVLRRWQVSRARRTAISDPLVHGLRPGVPAILYFSSPTCAPCHTQQRPALQRLLAELGDRVQVIEVNALEQRDVADRWGVLSVPTTVVLDWQGRPRAVNNGVTGPDTLRRQLQQG